MIVGALLPRPGAVDPAEILACRAAVQALHTGDLYGLLSAFGLAETLYAAGRDGMRAEGRRRIEDYLTRDLAGRLTIVPVEATIAAAAAEHRLTHYRTRSPISYADSVAFVIAERAGVPLVTVDAPLLALGDPRVVPPSQLRLSRS